MVSNIAIGIATAQQLPHETKISPYTGRSQPTPGLPMAPGGRYGWEGVACGSMGP